MSRQHRSAAVTASLLGAAAAAIYGAAAIQHWFPVPAERILDDAARTLASTGGDADGTALPLFVHVSDALWLQPIPVYLTAAALKLLNGTTAAPRLIAAGIAAISVALTYLATRRLLESERTGVIAAVLLALTPAHLLYGSTATTPIYSVPFVLVWLLCVFPERKSPARFATLAAGVVLGAGTYTNPEAVWTMAGFCVLTLAVLARDRNHRAAILLTTGFLVALLPLVPWFTAHPASYIDTMGRWAVHPAHIRNPIEGLGTFFRYDVFARRLSLYWDFFSPRHLFFTPQASALVWTGGVLLWPLLFFVPVGVYQLLSAEPRPRRVAILGGLLIPPIASATFDEQRSIAGCVTLLPFAAMAAALGIEALLQIRWIHSFTVSQRSRTPELR